MQIILGKNGGFCRGVERSVFLAKEGKKKYGDRLFCLHPLIHNAKIIADLNIPQKNINDLKKGDAVIISAHGTSPAVIEQMHEKGIEVLDATCPFICEIHRKAKEYSQQGYSVILVGDNNHVEIQGIKGCCERCQVIQSAEEADLDAGDKFVIFSQSTFSPEKYDKIVKKISENAKKFKKTLASIFSICYTTKENQREAEKIAKQCEIVLIVGDKTSANCLSLCKTVEENGAAAQLIQNVSDLDSVHINSNTKALGILAGASTPKESIMEVFYSMEEKVTDSLTEEVKENTEVNETVNTPVEEPVAEKTEEKKVTMAEALKKYGSGVKTYREGMRLKARVISADITGISVAIENGGKNDSGFIAKEEAEISGEYDAANYPADTLLDVIVIPKEPGDKNKAINLSKKAYDELKADDEKVVKILEGEEFTLEHTQEIKGGLLGKIGTYTIFIPASQIRMGYVSNLSEYVNKPLRLKILPAREEVDAEGNVRKHNPKRIVASQRIILEAEKAARDEEFWSKIYVGAIVSGKVKRFADFGAFVSLKYMDGLVHNSDLTWSKRRDIKAGDVLEINKIYDFIVLSVDRENGKIGLGYKQLQKKPIEIAQEKYPIGTIVDGKVAKVMKYGVFVELEPGLDGLVHISQVQRGFLENINDSSVKEGDEVKVKVMNYDDEKITLSIKEALPVEEVVVDTKEEDASDESKKDGKIAKDKKGKKGKEEVEDEGPHNFVSGGSNVSLGALFDKLKLATEDEDK